MKRLFILLLASFCIQCLSSQTIQAPDEIYGELFQDVQLSRIFPDSKTFVDCVPKKNPQEILQSYLKIKNNPNIRFSLKMFVEENFELPKETPTVVKQQADAVQHIKSLWSVLKRDADKSVPGSSLLVLPNPYLVPGGRFREIYYWDSYFTMLGLRESGENQMIGNMVDNFAYLISAYGFVPNGNRSYYLSRSQPPFFSLMLDMLASVKGNYVYATYLPVLVKEYDYWMDKTAPTRHLVKMPDGSLLNRYYDQSENPRQEAYYEDVAIAKKAIQKKEVVYRNLRSCAESGWDFSTRWFADGKNISTIQTINLIPVDLNSLIYHLEKTLAVANKESGNLVRERYFNELAERRLKAINKYCWSVAENWYVDYNFTLRKSSPELTIAGMTPFFFSIADQAKMLKAKSVLEKKFLKPGGVITTLKNSGQQWDAPNGWAPLQWIAINGLEAYGEPVLARDIAQRWVKLNVKVYTNTGRFMEKYNVVDISLPAGGGEYPSQDGFGWTNGVLLALMHKYDLRPE